MFNLDQFISGHVTHRPLSMFESDIKDNAALLTPKNLGLFVAALAFEEQQI